jgi:hypothetical protein
LLGDRALHAAGKYARQPAADYQAERRQNNTLSAE